MAIPPGPGPTSPVAPPTCFRHPGRETYVSCVRCGRPACPDCLRSAAVGQQCVECIRASHQGSRFATGTFGGRTTGAVPVVTYTLIAINVVVYIAEAVSGKVVEYGALIGGPAIDPRLHFEWVGVAIGDVYRLLTSGFLHEPLGTGYGITHILFNMWALWVVGPPLERHLGRVRFLSVYLISLIGGSILFYLVASRYASAIGASGAIFGLFGAWFVVAKRLRLDSRQVVMLIVLNLVITFAVPGIAWQGHLGGLVSGGALTAAYVYAPRANRSLIQVAATAGMLALFVIGLVIRDHQLVGSVMLRF